MVYINNNLEWNNEKSNFETVVLCILKKSLQKKYNFSNESIVLFFIIIEKLWQNDFETILNMNIIREILRTDSLLLFILARQYIQKYKHDINKNIVMKFIDLCSIINNEFHKLQVIKLFLWQIQPTSIQLSEYISKLDDYKFYEYALTMNISLSINQTNTINYKLYDMFKNFQYEKHKTIIFNIQDLRILDHMFIKEKNIHFWYMNNTNTIFKEDIETLYLILFKFLVQLPIKNSDIVFVRDYFNRSPSSFGLKVFISLLISTKKINNLILALYLSTEYSNLGNEIEILQLFLLRYFCLYDHIIQLYKKLKIKNIQIYNMAYVWLDVKIILLNYAGITDHLPSPSNLQYGFINDKAILLDYCYRFTKEGYISQAINVVETLDNLDHNIIMQEYNKHKIVATTQHTMFSDILGIKNSFLFDKITHDKLDNFSTKTGLVTINGITPFIKSQLNDIFHNEFCEIKSIRFIQTIKKALIIT